MGWWLCCDMTMILTGPVHPCNMAIPPSQQGQAKQAKPQQLIMLKREINANAAAIQDLKIIKAVGPTCCPVLKVCVVLAACSCMFEG